MASPDAPTARIQIPAQRPPPSRLHPNGPNAARGRRLLYRRIAAKKARQYELSSLGDWATPMALIWRGRNHWSAICRGYCTTCSTTRNQFRPTGCDGIPRGSRVKYFLTMGKPYEGPATSSGHKNPPRQVSYFLSETRSAPVLAISSTLVMSEFESEHFRKS